MLSDVRELAGEVRQEMEPQINDALTAHSAMRATADAACMARQLSRSNRGAGRGRGSESPDNIHAGALVPLQEASRSSLMSEASGSLVQYGEYDKLASQTAMLGQLDLRLDVRSAAHRRIVELLGHATSPALIRDALCKVRGPAGTPLFDDTYSWH